MITKFLLTALLMVAGWFVLSRLQGKRTKQRSKAPGKPPIVAQETVRCADCGIYLPLGQTCGCTDRA